jgi:hypothetical protein
MTRPRATVALAFVLLLAASAPAAQKSDESLRRTPAARLTSESVRVEPGAATAGLERVPTVVRSPDKRLTARVQTLSQGAESQRSRIAITGPGRRPVTIATLVNYFGLAWSPDGSKVAYSEGAVVAISDSDGRTRTVIHTGPGGRYPGACFDLAWSEDGRVLSFTQVENAQQLDLSTPVRVSITLGTRSRLP